MKKPQHAGESTHQNPELADQFTHLVEEAKRDPQIVALWLDGSRGKGVKVTEHSDYDVRMIVADGMLDEYQAQYAHSGQGGLDLGVMTLTDFASYAEYGTEEAWDRYNFSHLTAIVDKTDGHIQRLMHAKGCVPPEKQREIIAESLGGFLNQVYRAAKCQRDGDGIAAQFEAADAIPSLLTTMFALHGRATPYYKYLVWELDTYPLDKFPWKTDTFISYLLNIVTQGDIEVLVNVFQVIRPIFRHEGYGHVFDEWKGYYVVGEDEDDDAIPPNSSTLEEFGGMMNSCMNMADSENCL